MTQEEQAELNGKLLDASENGDNAEVGRLIAEGADVNAVDEDGYTPLKLAVMYGRIETVRALIAAGANVNAKDNNGQTPLKLAVMYGRIETVDALIVAEEVDVNAKDVNGKTPLHLATFWGHLETVKKLIAAGADVNAVDGNGRTPLDNAETRGNEFYNEVIDAIAKRINDTQRAEAFIMGSHNRLGAQSPVKMLAGETGYMEKILGKVASLKLSDIQEEHRKAVEARLIELQGKKVGSHAAKVAAEGQSVPSPFDKCLAKAAGLVGGILGAINTAIPSPPSHAEKVAARTEEEGQKAGCAIS